MTETEEDAEPPIREDYTPNTLDAEIIDVLRHGRASPTIIRDETDKTKQYINERLHRLIFEAGWVRKIAPGLYELRYDPDEGRSVTGYRPVYGDK